MSLCSANSINAARIVGQAGDPTLVSITDFLSAAIIVTLALDGLTTDLIVFSVSKETSFTRAHRLVIVGSTLSVASTEDQVARFLAFCLSNVVFNAPFVVITIVVGCATQFLYADVVATILIFWTTGVALAGGLAETIDAKLVTDTIPRATTEC